MRELVFRNLMSENAHKRDLIMTETLTKGDMVINTQRRCVYFMEDRIHIGKQYNLDKLNRLKEKGKPKKKHYFVIRKHNSKIDQDELFCRIRGFLYVVMGEYIYVVAFISSFKINIRKLTFSH